ncbi:sensor histidine kinase [Flavobacterium sp. WC2430]|uniref:sensor histidine kinase n=1 Tax=Flavobacterium sp. WC2430 TaxID=3234137 RepID=UPI00346580FC
MKLITKTSLYYLLLSIPILILSGFICFHILTHKVRHANDEVLVNRIKLIEQYLVENDTVSLQFLVKTKEAEINKTLKNNFSNGNKTIFSDTLILDEAENEMDPNRMVSSIVRVKNANYLIKIWRSSIENEELIKGILFLLIWILVALFLISMILNFWISKKMWKPFYTSVSNLEKFRASDNEIPPFEDSTIKEFTALNKSLASMMSKMIADYNAQKKFTENASHEIQTPLAVIKSKIDLLIQSENLDPNDVELIVAIDDACSKLNRLNKSLLLLTKIENRQFKTIEKGSVEKVLDSSLLLFDDYIKEKEITIVKNIETEFWINMNPDLGLVLINNLIQNAIRHNVDQGSIHITIKFNKIIIENTGVIEPLNLDHLFKRFQKKSTSHLSIGLGLAIANEIAEVSGLVLKYKFINNKHRFILKERD